MTKIRMIVLSDVIRKLGEEAKLHAEHWPENPFAKGMSHARDILDAALVRELDNNKPITSHDYAVQVGRSEQTIRRWCREGLLEHEKIRGVYWIPPHAEPTEIVKTA